MDPVLSSSGMKGTGSNFLVWGRARGGIAGRAADTHPLDTSSRPLGESKTLAKRKSGKENTHFNHYRAL